MVFTFLFFYLFTLHFGGTTAARPRSSHGKTEKRTDLLSAPQCERVGTGRFLHRSARGVDSRRASSARTGAFPRTHGLQRHKTFPRKRQTTWNRAVVREHRREVRGESERLHECRSDRLSRWFRASEARGNPRFVPTHSERLEPLHFARRQGNRQGTWRHPRGMAHATRRNGDAANDGKRDAAHLQRLEIRRLPAHRLDGNRR